jgi:hypothetical protein
MAAISDFINKQAEGLLPSSDGDLVSVGIGSYVSDVRVKESARFESSAPVTFLENGSFVNDHIINRPIVLQIEGEVSDIQERPTITQDLFKRFNQEVGNISRYLPPNTTSQINKIQSIASSVGDVIMKADDVENLYGLFGDKSSAKKNTKKFIDFLKNVRAAKIPIVIQMPYRKYANMVITSITINNDNQFEPLAYSLTAQQIRFAQIEFSAVENYKKNPSGGTGGQTDGAKNKGTNKPKEPGTSIASHILEWF